MIKSKNQNSNKVKIKMNKTVYSRTRRLFWTLSQWVIYLAFDFCHLEIYRTSQHKGQEL